MRIGITNAAKRIRLPTVVPRRTRQFVKLQVNVAGSVGGNLRRAARPMLSRVTADDLRIISIARSEAAQGRRVQSAALTCKRHIAAEITMRKPICLPTVVVSPLSVLDRITRIILAPPNVVRRVGVAAAIEVAMLGDRDGRHSPTAVW